MKRLIARWGYWTGFLTCFALVGLALILQVQFHLDPCPLCITQRVILMALGLVFLWMAVSQHLIHGSPGRAARIGLLMQAALAVLGAGIAVRHIWIQSYPDALPTECGVDFAYMLHNFPFQEFLTLLFQGTGECSRVDWTLLGITIPQLALLAFLLLGCWAVVVFRIRKTS